jgi:signal transduction histidine kinase
MAIVAGTIALIGYCDYLAGADVSLLVVYLVPICFATWVVGKRFGLFAAILSLAVWTFSNELAAGSHAHSPFVSGWNIFSVFCVFVIVIVLLSSFELFLQELEARVEERTQEMRRLEKEILDISEQEQRRIGNDLHDTVCQMLAGTTIAMKILEGKLAAKKLPESADAKEIRSFIQKAIEMTRDMARGLSPISMSPEGLMDAFHQLAIRVTQRHDIFCALDYNDPLFIKDVATATHLYLITQEAVTNAVRHSKASHILICIKNDGQRIRIEVQDNGVGMPENLRSGGMGMRVMDHRAKLIGAELAVRRAEPTGTVVTCTLNLSSVKANTKPLAA